MGGIDLQDLYEDIVTRRGIGDVIVRDTDINIYRKETWNELQTVVRGHDPEAYNRFLKTIADTPPVYLRDLLALRPRPRGCA